MDNEQDAEIATLEEAMRRKAAEQPNRSNPSSPNPDCQVDLDGHDGDRELLSIRGYLNAGLSPNAPILFFNVWVCQAHRKQLSE